MSKDYVGALPTRSAMSGISEVVITTDCLFVITGSNPVSLAILLKKNVLLLCSVTASTMGSGPIDLRSNRSREAEHSLICGLAG